MSALSPLQPSQETAHETRRLGFSLPLDPLLMLAVIGLGICSVVTIKAATVNRIAGDPHYFADRQIVYLVVGMALLLIISRLDYDWLRQLKYWIYGGLLLILLAALGLGKESLGSTRAISLPLFSFQSSEIGKVLLVVFLAAFIVDRARSLRSRDTTMRVIALTLVPTMIVIAEPDLGSSLVYISIALAALFIAGAPWKHFAALALLAVIAFTLVLVVAPSLGVHVLSKYQTERLTGFFNTTPGHVETSEVHRLKYQQEQSKLAIGAGRKTGLHDPRAVAAGYVPYDESDFIFASVGEQYGFVGAALVLSLFALMIWRALRILTMSKDLFGSLIAAGVVAMLMCQVFVNVGVAVGIMPDTGITLPLMSYGGSSVISTMLAIGLLQSIYVRARSSNATKVRAPAW
ncbi:MAG: FtsW/RodA/SpoVE family cell cycle protein [Solirubrobacteraceae bacterium]